VVIAISGLDSRKEDLSENFGAILLMELDSSASIRWHWAVADQGQRNRGTRILSRDRLLANQAGG